jgi:hypothetical protein
MISAMITTQELTVSANVSCMNGVNVLRSRNPDVPLSGRERVSLAFDAKINPQGHESLTNPLGLGHEGPCPTGKAF